MLTFKEYIICKNISIPIDLAEQIIEHKDIFAEANLANFVQGDALKKLAKGNSNAIIMALIKEYGAEFRRIIDEFKAHLGRLPTADDLIWVAGIHTHQDPFKVAERIKKDLGL